MNLPKEYRKGRFAILPIVYEKDVTYGIGAKNGPKEIIKASEHLEYYDEQFAVEPFVKGIEVLEEVNNLDDVTKTVKENEDKFIIGLGGDHAVTLGMTSALDENTSIIILDAHSDFRDSWKGSSRNHACVAKQLSKKHDVAILGVRSQDIDEAKQISNTQNLHVIPAWDFSLDKVKEILPKLKKKIYVSIDVDVFDPSFIRNTGTPEPGGLGWFDVVNILKEIFSTKMVVGCDLVEFAPTENFRAEAYALAKLVYKIMGLKCLYNN